MKKLLKRTFEFFEIHLRVRNPRLASKIYQSGGSAANFSRVNSCVVLKDTELIVNTSNAPFLARAGSEIRHLSSGAGATWRTDSNSKLIAQIQDLCFEVSSLEDVFVLNEVFALGVYAIQYPASAIVIDIGANIGASALFFASRPWVRHVFAFEPLKPTAQIARSNFDRNLQYKNKITLFEHGLGSKEETIDVEYSPEWKGKSGRRGLPEILIKTVPTRTETIAIENASKSFLTVLGSIVGEALVVKMDCEGAEWEVLPDLADSGVLKRIDQIVFEWHDRTPEPLEQLLVGNGFNVVRRTDTINAKIGLIYATNIGRRT